MTPQERDRLRAAWLTGGFDPEDRQRLLEAAAADQALFDELMDAEPLRELLAEPDTRAEALRRLRRAASGARLPWWRQRWTWAGAGALALAGVMLVAVLPSRRAVQEKSVEVAATRPAQTAPAAPPPVSQPAPALERKPERAAKPAATDAKVMDEAVAFAREEPKERKEERSAEADRRAGALGGTPGGVVGGIIGGVASSAPAPPPPPSAAAELASPPPAERERFGQRAPAGPMQQQAQAYQAAAARQDANELRAEAKDLAKKAGADAPPPVKTAIGVRQPDGAIQPLPAGEPVDRGARLVLSMEVAAAARVSVAGVRAGATYSRTLAPGERWDLDLPTSESGARTLRVTLGPPAPSPAVGFAGSFRAPAALSLTYRVR